MKKEVFSLVVGSVLFISGSFLIAIGFMIEYDMNYYSNSGVDIVGGIVVFVGILFYLYTWFLVFKKDKNAIDKK